MGAATHLSFSVQPSASFDSEVLLPQQPVVQALDAGNAVDTTYTGLVTLTVPLGNIVQTAGNALAPVTLNCVAGVASFSGVNVSAGQPCALVASASGLTSATSATMTPTAVGGRDQLAELPRVTPDITYPATITTVYRVGVGQTYTTIQAAINQAVTDNANTHSEIQVDPGVWGNFQLKKKASGTGLIVIRPVGALPCARGTRVQPSMFASGAVQIAPGSGSLAVTTENGAAHYRLVGLEIIGNAGTFLQLAEAGGATSVANCPDDLGIDRCYIHGSASLESVRAIEYGAKSLFVVDSYIADIHCSEGSNGDTQTLGGWAAPGPLLMQNNYLEAAGEITMLGGADIVLTDVVTSDVTFRGNHYRKPVGWKGVKASKNLTELKSARRVLYEGNVFENQWYDAQDCAITFGSASQSGTSPWMGIRDLTFRYNIVRNASRFIVLNRANGNPVGPVKTGITTSTSGGTFGAAVTRYYRITAIFNTAGFSGTESSYQMTGESGDNEQSITTGAGSTNSITVTWQQLRGAIGYRVYRGTTAGSENTYFAVSGGATTSFTDTGSAGTAGTPPTVEVYTLPTPMHRASVHDNLGVVNNAVGTPFENVSGNGNVYIQGVDDLSFVHNTFPADTSLGLYLGSPAPLRGRFAYNIGSYRSYAISGNVGGADGHAMLANEFASGVTKNVALDIQADHGIDLTYFGGDWEASTTATVGFADATKLTGSAIRPLTFAQVIAAATLTSGSYANTTWTGDGKMVGADMTALSAAIAGAWVPGEGTLLDGVEPGAAGAATQLLLSTQPAGAVSGNTLTTQPSGTVADSGGSTVTSDSSTVTASWVLLTGDAVPTGTLTTTASSGAWAFSNLGLSWTETSTGYWHFTDGSLTSVNSSTLSLTVAPPPPPPDTGFGITPGAPAQYRMARGKAVFAGFRRLVRAVWHWLTLSASLA